MGTTLSIVGVIVGVLLIGAGLFLAWRKKKQDEEYRASRAKRK